MRSQINPADPVAVFAALPHEQRVAQIDAFLAVNRPYMLRLAMRMCPPDMNVGDEPLQAVMSEAHGLLTMPDLYLTEVRSPGAVLVDRAVKNLQREIRGMQPAGTRADERKRGDLEKLRRAMQMTLGVDPTPEQLAAEHNARMIAKRKDPAKSGLILTPQDVERLSSPVPPPVSLNADPELTQVADDQDVADLAALSGVVDAVVTECDRLSRMLGQVARALLSPTLEGLDSPTLDTIAAQLEVSTAQVRRQRVLIQGIVVKHLDRHAEQASVKS
ncbi:hypothetical protein [Branchiibius sp. NY16-3462-2]|uniref:Sigma-70 family RNA polymerase sigma factor n=1 Tax=Branchiibius cervicis TaxID=908252 RepID=A0ABW2AUT3_9MICO|nr:hypothetical protein [Branchiibius sp. NY16-3462-2]KYH43889.1 hypothetical protein AZH51_15765 [Branchiibius sp. NY16-3462-2]